MHFSSNLSNIGLERMVEIIEVQLLSPVTYGGTSVAWPEAGE